MPLYKREIIKSVLAYLDKKKLASLQIVCSSFYDNAIPNLIDHLKDPKIIAKRKLNKWSKIVTKTIENKDLENELRLVWLTFENLKTWFLEEQLKKIDPHLIMVNLREVKFDSWTNEQG